VLTMIVIALPPVARGLELLKRQAVD